MAEKLKPGVEGVIPRDPSGIDDDRPRRHPSSTTLGEKALVYGTLFVVIPLAAFGSWWWRGRTGPNGKERPPTMQRTAPRA